MSKNFPTSEAEMVRSSFWVALSMMTGRGAVMLAGILIANGLGATAFAVFSFVHVTATSISNIATVGMQNGIPRYFARLGVDRSSTTLSHIAVAFLFALSGLLLAVACVSLLPGEVLGLNAPATKIILIVLLLVIGLNNLFVGATNGLERFSDVSVATVIQGGAILIAGCLAIYLARPEIALWGYSAATFISIAILLFGILRHIRDKFRAYGIDITTKRAREVMLFCGPLFSCTILFNSGLWLNGRSVLSHEDGALAYAEFALGLQWFSLACLAPTVIGRVVLPRITQLGYVKDRAGTSRAVLSGIALSFGCTLVALLGVVAFSDFIVSLYGDDFRNAKEVLLLFVLAAVISSPIDIVATGLVSMNRQMTWFYLALLWWGILMVLTIFLSKSGAYGAVGALVVSYLIFSIAAVYIAVRYGLVVSNA